MADGSGSSSSENYSHSTAPNNSFGKKWEGMKKELLSKNYQAYFVSTHGCIMTNVSGPGKMFGSELGEDLFVVPPNTIVIQANRIETKGSFYQDEYYIQYLRAPEVLVDVLEGKYGKKGEELAYTEVKPYGKLFMEYPKLIISLPGEVAINKELSFTAKDETMVDEENWFLGLYDVPINASKQLVVNNKTGKVNNEFNINGKSNIKDFLEYFKPQSKGFNKTNTKTGVFKMSDVVEYVSNIPNKENKLRIIFNHSCSNLPKMYHIKTILRYEMLKKLMETPREPLTYSQSNAVLDMAKQRTKTFEFINSTDGSKERVTIPISVFTELEDIFISIQKHFHFPDNFIVTNDKYLKLDVTNDVFDYFSFFSDETKVGFIFKGTDKELRKYFKEINKEFKFAEALKCVHTGSVASIEEVSAYSGKELKGKVSTRCTLQEKIKTVHKLMDYLVKNHERPLEYFEEFYEKGQLITEYAEIVPDILTYYKITPTSKELAIQKDIETFYTLKKNPRAFAKLEKEGKLAKQVLESDSSGKGGGKTRKRKYKTRKHTLKKNKRSYTR